jgi:heme/copper-type cytochrome/quinol oxidase subunit 4
VSDQPNGLHASHQAGRSPSQAPREEKTGFWRSRIGIATVVFLAIAGVLLVAEHRAHALGALPYLLILAFPLLHIFMHGGHGSHGGTDSSSSDDRRNPPHQH